MIGKWVGGKMGCRQEESDEEMASRTGCQVWCVFGEGCGGGHGEGLHGCGSGTGRDGGTAHMGENGYQAWAIMSPYGSEGTY